MIGTLIDLHEKIKSEKNTSDYLVKYGKRKYIDYYAGESNAFVTALKIISNKITELETLAKSEEPVVVSQEYYEVIVLCKNPVYKHPVRTKRHRLLALAFSDFLRVCKLYNCNPKPGSHRAEKNEFTIELKTIKNPNYKKHEQSRSTEQT